MDCPIQVSVAIVKAEADKLCSFLERQGYKTKQVKHEKKYASHRTILWIVWRSVSDKEWEEVRRGDWGIEHNSFRDLRR